MLLIVTGKRIRKRTSRLRFSDATAIYGFGAFTSAGAAALALGSFLLSAGF